jgi:hypothetical protein
MPKPVWKKFNNNNNKNNDKLRKSSRLDEIIALPDFSKRNKYKSNMCKSMKEHGECDMGEYCLFAHSEKEIRKPICQYGSRCVIRNCIFEHSEDATLPEILVRPPKPQEVVARESEETSTNCPIMEEFIIELSDDEYDEEEEKRYNESWVRKKVDVNDMNYEEMFEEDYGLYKRMFIDDKQNRRKNIPKNNREFFKEINANIYCLEKKFEEYVSRKRSSDEVVRDPVDDLDISKLSINEPVKKKRQMELNCTDKQYEYISNLLKNFK